MCTLIVLHRCLPGRPLVVAANRDEFLARPAEDFAIRETASGRILSPRDLEAGGTWLGLSHRGVFAGLTNLRPASPSCASGADGVKGDIDADGGRGEAVPVLLSRGEVVMAALEADSASAAARSFEDLAECSYNPFQLLIADEHDAFLVVYRDRARVVALEPGPHIVGNVEDARIAKILGTDTTVTTDAAPVLGKAYPGFEGIDGLSFEANDGKGTEEPRALKLTRIRSSVEKMITDPSYDLFEGLARICREHVEDEGVGSPFEATCVHIPDGNTDRYGTRSSMLLELSEDVGSSRLWVADGAPCQRPFENRSPLLKELGLKDLGSKELGLKKPSSKNHELKPDLGERLRA
ncbi:NRDE family protein [Myxococcota bacterium]|nr:NRDE family protein [Myxococcota bacterium]